MIERADTKFEGLSGAPLFGPSTNYMHVSTREGLTYTRSSVLAAGLAHSLLGEGRPADAGHQVPAKGARPAGDPFDLAALLCGHDPTTGVGAADARHDFRVWDLLDHLEGA